MKNEIFDNMLSRYDLTTEQHKRNAIFEVNQQMILAGLYAGGFFESAAFYGGTCLRIFHGLQRFSEDMDFSLLAQDDNFDFNRRADEPSRHRQPRVDRGRAERLYAGAAVRIARPVLHQIGRASCRERV